MRGFVRPFVTTEGSFLEELDTSKENTGEDVGNIIACPFLPRATTNRGSVNCAVVPKQQQAITTRRVTTSHSSNR